MIKSAMCMYVVGSGQIEKYGFTRIPRLLVNVVLARHIELLSIADSQIAKHGFLSSKQLEVATSQQICRVVPILFKSSHELYIFAHLPDRFLLLLCAPDTRQTWISIL